jgi:putative Holliday junction resolvase
MTLLAFDVGSKRIGVALGSSYTGARPLAVVLREPEHLLWQQCLKLIKDWGAQQLIVGLPLTLDGHMQAISELARSFAVELQQRSGLPVIEWDERFSSKNADRRFAELRAAGVMRRKDAALQDAMAAAMILEDFLLNQSQARTPEQEPES